MNKLLKLGLALTLVIALVVISTGSVLAATNLSGSEVSGVITAINKTATPNTVTIAPEKGRMVVLNINTTTVITKTGVGAATINDLSINDKATVTYDPTTYIASKIAGVQDLGERQSFEGTIKSITGNILIVTTNKGDETFDVSSAAVYNVPGISNATLANFAVGNKVIVSTAEVTTNGTTIQMAQRMNLIPAKPIKTTRTGTVTACTVCSSITIQDKAGTVATFIINSDTKISYKKGTTAIALGDQVTISASRNPSDSQFTAKTIRDLGVKQVKTGTNKGNQNGQGNGKEKKNKNK